jgi:hypothetical protein
MAPADKPHLPLRWEFVPSKQHQDGSILWSWRAYTQSGKVAMKSGSRFDSLTACIEDAKAAGYVEP